MNKKLPSRNKSAIIAFSALALSALASLAQASPVVNNGSFESTTGGAASFFLDNGPASLTGWFLGPPKGISNEIVFAPGTADTTGATRSDGVQFGLWGPMNGVANGLPATSPVLGNFVAFDGDTKANVSLNQTITDLTKGAKYQLSFYWAAAQYCFINSPPLIYRRDRQFMAGEP